MPKQQSAGGKWGPDMSDRLAAIILALLLAAPLCLNLDVEIFGAADTSAHDLRLPPPSPEALPAEALKKHAEGLQDAFGQPAALITN